MLFAKESLYKAGFSMKWTVSLHQLVSVLERLHCTIINKADGPCFVLIDIMGVNVHIHIDIIFVLTTLFIMQILMSVWISLVIKSVQICTARTLARVAKDFEKLM